VWSDTISTHWLNVFDTTLPDGRDDGRPFVDILMGRPPRLPVHSRPFLSAYRRVWEEACLAHLNPTNYAASDAVGDMFAIVYHMGFLARLAIVYDDAITRFMETRGGYCPGEILRSVHDMETNAMSSLVTLFDQIVAQDKFMQVDSPALRSHVMGLSDVQLLSATFGMRSPSPIPLELPSPLLPSIDQTLPSIPPPPPVPLF